MSTGNFEGRARPLYREKRPLFGENALIPGFLRKSIREGASSLFGRGPESPSIVSCSRATPRLHQCNLGVALEQERFLGLSGPVPKKTTCSFPY